MRRPLHVVDPMQDVPNNKRPLSPGGSAIISPAKRRNLAEQDVFSPEHAFQRPSSLRKTIASASRFGDVLVGPQSPARILNFGLPKHLAGDPEKRPVPDDVHLITPTQPQPSSSRLAPSPELKPQGTRTRHAEVDDLPTDSCLPCRPNTSSRCSYTLIPRELPPRPDPYSIHYPGFVVYQDPYIAAYVPQPCEDEHEEGEDGDEEESWKENSRVAITKNLATPRSSSFSKAFLDGDKATPLLKFEPAGLVSSPCTEVAGPSSANVGKGKKNSRHILLEELDFEEDCVDEE